MCHFDHFGGQLLGGLVPERHASRVWKRLFEVSHIVKVASRLAPVGQHAHIAAVDLLHQRHHPVGIIRNAAMVFDQHIDARRNGIVQQQVAGFGRPLQGFLLVDLLRANAIDAYRMATQVMGGVDPLAVVDGELLPAFEGGCTGIAFSITHDQHTRNTLVFGVALQCVEIVHGGGTLKQGIHKLDPADAKILFGDPGEVEGFPFALPHFIHQRPLRQRDPVFPYPQCIGRGRFGYQQRGSHETGGSQCQ